MNMKTLHALMGNKALEAAALCVKLCDNSLEFKRDDIDCIKLFTKLCRLAKTRHCYVLWEGCSSVCCQPDKFSVIKNGIAYYFNYDSLKYSGANARSYNSMRYSISSLCEGSSFRDDCL